MTEPLTNPLEAIERLREYYDSSRALASSTTVQADIGVALTLLDRTREVLKPFKDAADSADFYETSDNACFDYGVSAAELRAAAKLFSDLTPASRE